MSSHSSGSGGPSNLIDERREDPSFEEQLSRKIRNKQLLEQEAAAQKLWEEREERKRFATQKNWEIYTGGRDKLITKQFQVIFKDGQCSVCSQLVKFVDIEGGYNPWAMGRYKDPTIPYDPIQNEESLNYEKVHSCTPEPEYLRRRIEILEKFIKELNDSLEQRIRAQVWANIPGMGR
jgi:hypothetical protein